MVDDMCAREESALAWQEDTGKGSRGQGQRSFTTTQLIVQPGYMLQFKVQVVFVCFVLCLLSAGSTAVKNFELSMQCSILAS